MYYYMFIYITIFIWIHLYTCTIYLTVYMLYITIYPYKIYMGYIVLIREVKYPSPTNHLSLSPET